LHVSNEATIDFEVRLPIEATLFSIPVFQETLVKFGWIVCSYLADLMCKFTY